MVKKMNLSEKRKLERRLPLWESAYPLSLPEEKRSLLQKIDNARYLLGMEPFIKPKEKSETKKEQKQKEKQEKRERGELPLVLVGKNLKEFIKKNGETICSLRNDHGMTDNRIADYLNISKTQMNLLKKRLINEVYEYNGKVKDGLYFDANKYCEMINCGYTKEYIAKEFGMSSSNLFYHAKKKVIPRFKVLDSFKLKDFEVDRLNIVCELLNKGMTIREMINKKIVPSNVFRLTGKYIFEDYIPAAEEENMNVKSYLHDKNVLKLTDLEISEKYGLHKETVCRFKKLYIIKKYYLKNV